MKRNFLSESIEFKYNNRLLPKYYVIKPFYNGEILFDYWDVYDPYLYTWEDLFSLITLKHVSILEPELYKQKKDIKMKDMNKKITDLDGLITLLVDLKKSDSGSLHISDLKITITPDSSMPFSQKTTVIEMSSFKSRTTTIK